MEKVLIGAGITLGAVEVANEGAAGVMWAKGEESDSILKGKYSLVNLFRSKIKKDDEQPSSGGKNPKKCNPEELRGKKGENIEQEKQKKLDAILAKFEKANTELFNQKKVVLTGFFEAIFDGKYGRGDGYNKEIADKIMNFIDNPDDEQGVTIVVKNSNFFAFSLGNGVLATILFAPPSSSLITCCGKRLLEKIGKPS